MRGVYGVVHTLGTLLEAEDGGDSYKAAVRAGNLGALVAKLVSAHGGGNPLERGVGRGSYEVMNRDSGAQEVSTVSDRTFYCVILFHSATRMRDLPRKRARARKPLCVHLSGGCIPSSHPYALYHHETCSGARHR
jgi:hypothetical protein